MTKKEISERVRQAFVETAKTELSLAPAVYLQNAKLRLEQDNNEFSIEIRYTNGEDLEGRGGFILGRIGEPLSKIADLLRRAANRIDEAAKDARGAD